MTARIWMTSSRPPRTAGTLQKPSSKRLLKRCGILSQIRKTSNLKQSWSQLLPEISWMPSRYLVLTIWFRLCATQARWRWKKCVRQQTRSWQRKCSDSLYLTCPSCFRWQWWSHFNTVWQCSKNVQPDSSVGLLFGSAWLLFSVWSDFLGSHSFYCSNPQTLTLFTLWSLGW